MDASSIKRLTYLVNTAILIIVFGLMAFFIFAKAKYAYESASLIVKGSTTVRFYFTDEVGFTVDGEDVKVNSGKKGNSYYYEIAEIRAVDIDKMYNITVTYGSNEFKFTYGPFS